MAACLISYGVHADGERDSNFGISNGVYAFRISGATINDARAVAMQADRKIVMAGGCDQAFCVARLLANGDQDTSFSGPSGLSGGSFRLILSASVPSVLSSIVTSVAIDEQGRILLAGYCTEFTTTTLVFPCLARLLGNGRLDPSFDGPDQNGVGLGMGSGNGVVVLRRATVLLENLATPTAQAAMLPPRGVAMALQPDGKIVLGYSCRDGDTIIKFCLFRLLSNGQFDPSFARDENSLGGEHKVSVAGAQSHLAEIAVQPDGNILAVGSCLISAIDVDFCAARLLGTNGQFDLNFDGGDVNSGTGNGRVTFPVGSANDFATSLSFTPDGFIVIAGACANGTRLDFCARQLAIDDGRTHVFSGSGFPGFLLSISSTGSSVATGVAMQSDGRIVLTGVCDSGAGTRQFCATRFHRSGLIDVSYDGDENVLDGKFLVPPLFTNDFALAQTMQFDDKSVVVGRCESGVAAYFCVARLANAYSFRARPARTCDLDLDGDGQILATVDGLILIRIMLGIRDSRVMNGITVAATADRPNWASIRDHLVTRCGMPFLRH